MRHGIQATESVLTELAERDCFLQSVPSVLTRLSVLRELDTDGFVLGAREGHAFNK